MQNKNAKTNVHLSKNIIPIEYEIQLKPDLDNFIFEGIETITIDVLEKTKSITLHSKDIEILTAEYQESPLTRVFGKIFYDTKKETATFTFSKLIPKGKTKLVLVFRGILNDKMRGFYRSRYEIDGKENFMATTQFEATDARKAFPCFDEPAHKAVFNVSLIVPNGKTAISNTLPTSIQEHEGRYKIVKFAPTPKMSTYLLAFIVGDFEYIEAYTTPPSGHPSSIRRGRSLSPLIRESTEGEGVSGVCVRVYTTPGKKHQAKFALDVAVKVLEFYEKYFDIPYPLNTLDMIAIPDFSSAAMENWGAITYREAAILVDEQHSSADSRQWVALVIAHEIAHQWFGNLVTMEWWTHLWLNEGFASYIECLAVEALFPEYKVWDQFVAATIGGHGLSSALRLDSLDSTHPIEVEVHHPDEIGEIFDEVSYSKGASIIRMLANYLGEKDFRDGLRHYLKKHSYKNTETFHLWQAFEKVSGKTVAKMMHNWTSKGGYPVIKAEIVKGKLVLSQNRFFASAISKKKSKDKTTWEIPILIKNQNSSQVCFLENRKEIVKTNFLRGLASDGEPTSGFFKLQKIRTDKKLGFHNFFHKINFGETGFFRTAYSSELLEKLKKPVEEKILPPVDRLGIIRDLFALSEAGLVNTNQALSFLPSYKNETEYIVWLEIAKGLGTLQQIFAKNKSILEKIDRINLELFSPLARKLGWQKKVGESHMHTLLRPVALSRAGSSGDKKIILEAKKKFTAFKKGTHLDPDIRDTLYTIIAKNGARGEYNFFIKKYKKETLHEEKNRVGTALGSFNDVKILKQVCDFAMSKDVRIQDTVGILSQVGINPLGREIWWNFVKKNWKTFVSRYGEGGLNLSRVLRPMGMSAEERHFKDFKKFFKTHTAPGATRTITQILERVENNVDWKKRDEKKIENFFKTRLF
jgi:puromycin-sensitive aminopeptidase